MNKLFSVFVAALLSAGIAGVAAATIYPNPLCPDSMTIQRLQDPTALCHPAATDTTYGTRGIYIATDSIPTAYGFWIETAVGGAYSGIDVFTGTSNYQSAEPGTPTGGNLFYGDLLGVDGRSLEFRGLTELTDFDNIQSTNDIIVRRYSTGNALPPYHIGTPLELDWVPGWTSINGSANQEPWEGVLVKVKGPLVCGRIVGTGLGGNSMLVSAPGGLDSLVIDGFSLTNSAALTVGSPIDSVQGVFTQSLISAVASYRILLRNTSDLFAAAPPNVIDAYPIAENSIRIIFDRPVQAASATNTNNYSLQSFGSVDSAVLEAGSKSVVLTVSAAAAHGTSETVTVSGVVSSSGLTMAGNQPRTFIYGVLSIAELQQPDATASGLAGSPCHDHSRFVTATGGSGPRLTYTGVITGDFGNLYYIQDAAGGLRSGIPIFAPPVQLVEGKKYLISGQVQEFDGISAITVAGLTEAVGTQYVSDLGAGAAINPVVQTIAVLRDSTCDAAQTLITAEDYEGMLVTVKHVRVAENQTSGQSFLIAGPNPSFAPDTMLVTNSNSAYSYAADSAHTVTITGLLNYRNSAKLPWRITPRNDEDIVDEGLNKLLGVGPQASAAELKLAVSPNPSRSARVSFTVPRTGKVDLGVFDLAGRRLVTIIDSQMPAGEYSKVWNGREANGAPVRSGVYFYRLKVGDQLVTTRAIKLD